MVLHLVKYWTYVFYYVKFNSAITRNPIAALVYVVLWIHNGPLYPNKRLRALTSVILNKIAYS